jgi:hypothetical protein
VNTMSESTDYPGLAPDGAVAAPVTLTHATGEDAAGVKQPVAEEALLLSVALVPLLLAVGSLVWG